MFVGRGCEATHSNFIIGKILETNQKSAWPCYAYSKLETLVGLGCERVAIGQWAVRNITNTDNQANASTVDWLRTVTFVGSYPKTPTYTLSFEVGNHQSSRHPQRDLSCWECCTFRQIKLTVRESIYDRCGPTVPFRAMYATSTRSTRSQKASRLCPTLRTYFLADVQPSFSLAVYPKTQSTWRQHNLGDLSIRYQGFLEEVGVLYNWEASSLLTNISSFEINNPAARNYGRSRSAASVNSGNKEISIAAGPAPKDSIQPNRWLMSL